MAREFINDTLPLIIKLSRPTAIDSYNRYAARAERDVNGKTRQALGVIPKDEPLPAVEPLPFDGRFSLIEMVEHDRVAGGLAEEMAARRKGGR